MAQWDQQFAHETYQQNNEYKLAKKEVVMAEWLDFSSIKKANVPETTKANEITQVWMVYMEITTDF